jgi:hypothetical protein
VTKLLNNRVQGVVDSMLRTHGLLRDVLARRFINDEMMRMMMMIKRRIKTIILSIRIRKTPQTRFTGTKGRITSSRNAPGPHLGRKNARLPPCEEWGGRRRGGGLPGCHIVPRRRD